MTVTWLPPARSDLRSTCPAGLETWLLRFAIWQRRRLARFNYATLGADQSRKASKRSRGEPPKTGRYQTGRLWDSRQTV